MTTKTQEEFGSGVFDSDFGTATITDGKLTKFEKKDDEGDGEEMESAALDVSAIVKAIQDGSISVADFKEIEAAMAEMGAGDEAPLDDTEAPAMAAAPGAEAMSDNPETVETMAAVRGENRALRAEFAKLRNEFDRKEAVNAAVFRLLPKLGGSEDELRKELTEQHEKSPQAFNAYVAALAKFERPPTDHTEIAGSPKVEKFSAEAQKYAEQGPDAVRKAEEFRTQHQWLASRGFKVSAEKFIANRMAETEQGA